MATVNLSKQTVNISKSQTVNLSKQSEGLKKVMIGLGWDEASGSVQTIRETVNPGFFGKMFGAQPKVIERTVSTRSDANMDLDAWVCFMKDGKTIMGDDSLLYYGNKDISKGNVNFAHHCGDNLTGAGDGDDEQIILDLSNIPDKFNGAVIGVTIYQGKERHQSFGDVKNMFVRVVDQNDNFEICKYADTVAQEYKDCITFIVGKIYRDKGEWQFKADGFGTKDRDISAAVRNYKG